MTRSHLRGELVTLMLAGHETSAHTLCTLHVLWYLAHAFFQPYLDPVDNRLEDVTLVLLVIISIITAMFSTAANGFPPGAQAAVGIFFLVPALAFLLFMVWESIQKESETINKVLDKVRGRDKDGCATNCLFSCC